MRNRPSHNNQKIDKQQIVNYQYQILQESFPQVKPIISNTEKYATWELDQKIKEILSHQSYSIRWIGNSTTAYLETYAYILLVGTGYSESNILQFKHIIYKIGRKCLELAEQKVLVQFLCLIQYSRDRYSFLNKYPQIQAVFIKILQYLQQEHTNSDDSVPQNNNKAKVKHKSSSKPKPSIITTNMDSRQNHSHRSISLSQQLEYEKQLEQIYQSFNKYFSFISLLGSNQYSCTLKLFNRKKIYVIIEKQCYFMVEPCEKSGNEDPFPTLGKERQGDCKDERKNGLGYQLEEIDAFDKHQFEEIFSTGKNQVQESNVISIDRGSQIRKKQTQLLLNNSNTPKFANFPTPNIKQRPNEFETTKKALITDDDHSLIDQLIGNVQLDIQRQTSLNKVAIVSDKQKLMADNMKGILMIKEELKRVKSKLEDKIKKFDQVEQFKMELALKMQDKQTSKFSEFQQKFKANIIKNSIVKKHQKFNFLKKKKRKPSYNSANNIPHNTSPQLAQLASGDNSFLDIPMTPNHRQSAKQINQRVKRLLSEKAISRPQSNFRQIQQTHKYSKKYKSPEEQRKGGSGDYNIRSLSPKNVNVNVNVNINENLLRPILNQHSPYSNRYNTGTNIPQYYITHQPRYINPHPNYYGYPQQIQAAKRTNPTRLANPQSFQFPKSPANATLILQTQKTK